MTTPDIAHRSTHAISPLDWYAGLMQLPRERHAVLVSIIDAAGSTPRTKGSRMLVTPETQFDTIGGGHLEWKALAMARLWLAEPLAAQPVSVPRTERLALGPSLGQCCGGVVQIALERLDQLSDAEFAARMQQYRLNLPKLPHLYLFGAGHVGAALVQVLAQVPCRISWVDERDHLFPRHLPANVCTEDTDVPEAVIADAEAGSYYLVMTHHHGLDLRLSEHILRRDDAAWFGLIGSQTKRVNFERRLQERGIAAAKLADMTCPIGVPGINGKEPGVIAVAVAAQLLQLWSEARTLDTLADTRPRKELSPT
ncbi:xanthine dehydrogenase accessory protein XdhC [Undibacterium sp.]|jgi:xanthine dehydrogenase accessory factor|uniref:xanthine dehydrogenase accessory protein XdhC n=1 Tax=Undibacterium sp. TaxID=1914977 RepID=UPI002B61F23C|nr:xanthine dehydrogenase accessory protein XdhC [Undibacterium sp.]HTD03788.1 xanthine dehydrogenase accessory protein XdhC [Undibacterium sp.]